MKRGIILVSLVCIVLIVLVGGVVSATLSLSGDSSAPENARWLPKDSSSQGNINQYIATATPNPTASAANSNTNAIPNVPIQPIVAGLPIQGNPFWNNPNIGTPQLSTIGIPQLSTDSATNSNSKDSSSQGNINQGLTGNSRATYCSLSCPSKCCDGSSCTIRPCPGPTSPPTRAGACENPPKGDLKLLIYCGTYPIRQDKINLIKTPKHLLKTPIQNPEKSNTPTSIHLLKTPIQNPEKSNTPSRENQPLANNPKGIDSRSDAFQGFGNPFSLPIFAGGFQNLPQFAGIQNNMWPNNQGVPNIPNQQPNPNQAANNNILPKPGDKVQGFMNILPEEVGQPPQQDQQQPGAQPEQVASDNVIPKGPPYLNGGTATYSPGFGDLWESVKNFFNNLF